LQAREKLPMLVYIVESPSPQDVYDGVSEGSLLSGAASLERIPSVVRTVTNLDKLHRALTLDLAQAVQHYSRKPILHISAHGATTGIQLTDGGHVSWEQLAEWLRVINKAMNGYLLLCLSACHGFSACTVALQGDEDDAPYFAIVSNRGTPTWSETAVGYMTFYHQMANHVLVPAAVEAMKTASMNEDWDHLTSKTARAAWAWHLSRNQAEEAQSQLRERGPDLG